MSTSLFKSVATAVFVAAAIQSITVGVLAPKLPREVCRPLVQDTRSMTFEPVDLVQLLNTDGAIQVLTHTEPVIKLDATIRAYTPSSQSRELAEAYVSTLLAARERGDMIKGRVLRIVTEPEQRPDEVDLRVDFKLTVPEGTDVSIDGANGNVWVAKGCGRVSVEGNNTDIEIHDPQGAVQARSANGRIRVYDARGRTTLETVNGSIHAHMRGGSLQASTTNGGIVTTLYDGAVERCDLNSLNGGITLVLSDGCSAKVNARTGRGIVRTDVALAEEGGVLRRQELMGVIGEGRTQLSMNSLNGNIWITRSGT